MTRAQTRWEEIRCVPTRIYSDGVGAPPPTYVPYPEKTYEWRSDGEYQRFDPDRCTLSQVDGMTAIRLHFCSWGPQCFPLSLVSPHLPSLPPPPTTTSPPLYHSGCFLPRVPPSALVSEAQTCVQPHHLTPTVAISIDAFAS